MTFGEPADAGEPRSPAASVDRAALKRSYALSRGVEFEPFQNGSALLYSRRLQESLSLNPTAALLCAHADAEHTLAEVLTEVGREFPDGDLDAGAALEFLEQMVGKGFLEWR